MFKRIYNLFYLLIFLLPCMLILFIPGMISEFVSQSLNLCAFSVIPSLFPFMVITQFVSRTDIALNAGKSISFILSPIFGINPKLCGAFLTGLAGGFPNGAHAVGIAYTKGICTKKDAERAVALCNNCSLAFVCSYAGMHALGSIKAGIILFTSLLLSVLVSSLVLRVLFSNKDISSKYNKKITTEAKQPLYKVFCQSICSAGTNTLYVCSFITFFNIISGLLTPLLSMNRQSAVLINGIFEVSGAVNLCSVLNFPGNYIFCSAIIGFSGLSVIFQVLDVCEKYEISPVEFIVSRFITALFMPMLTVILLIMLPREAIYVFGHIDMQCDYGNFHGFSVNILYVLIFIVAILFLYVCRCTKNKFINNSKMYKKSSALFCKMYINKY